MNNISRTALRVTSRVFYRFIGVKLASHRTVKVFTATRQKKFGITCSTATTKIIKTLFFEVMIKQHFFHVLILIVNPLCLPK